MISRTMFQTVTMQPVVTLRIIVALHAPIENFTAKLAGGTRDRRARLTKARAQIARFRAVAEQGVDALVIRRALHACALRAASQPRCRRTLTIVQTLNARIQRLAAKGCGRLAISRSRLALSGGVVASLVAVAIYVVNASIRENAVPKKANVLGTCDSIVALRILCTRCVRPTGRKPPSDQSQNERQCATMRLHLLLSPIPP